MKMLSLLLAIIMVFSPITAVAETADGIVETPETVTETETITEPESETEIVSELETETATEKETESETELLTEKETETISDDLEDNEEASDETYILEEDIERREENVKHFRMSDGTSKAVQYKEQYGQSYTYDDNGNVVSAVDLAKTNSSFAYYGSQMSKMLNPSGSRYFYTYDNKKQLYSAMSTDGQDYVFTYDNKSNLTKAEVKARNIASEIPIEKINLQVLM